MHLTFFVAAFLWLFRYVRLIVNCLSHWTFKPVPIPENPTYDARDVTVILPTIATGGEGLETTISSVLRSEPWEVILVTIDANKDALERLASRINSKKIRVLSIREANKRRQMCRALPEVVTRITIFVDDDVEWPRKLMPWILAPFENPRVGGVGTSQRLKRPEHPNMWDFHGAVYLERRNFDCSACLNIDGGLPCLSGRTVAYRSSILQDEAFTHGFTHETWRTNQLNADDDNFITRWLYAKGWKIAMQYHKEAEVKTTLENSPKYLDQCLRWVRSNWRSNLTSLFKERHYWYTQPWSTYSVLQTTLTAWALPVDISIFVSWYIASLHSEWSPGQCRALFSFLFLWTFVFSKSVKIWGHFLRYPEDLKWIFNHIGFGYYHGYIKAKGMFTMSETTWGSRAGADTDDRVRMIKLPDYDTSSDLDGRKSETFDYPQAMLEVEHDQLPAYDTHSQLGPDHHLLEHVPLVATTTHYD